MGFKKSIFKAVQVYLYTDQCPEQLTLSEMLSVIELANFLCLPRLVALAEQRLVQSFKEEASEKERDIGENISYLLETCKVKTIDVYHAVTIFVMSPVCNSNHKYWSSLYEKEPDYFFLLASVWFHWLKCEKTQMAVPW